MRKMQITIETENDQFGNSDEEIGYTVAHILFDVRLRILQGDLNFIFADENGNRVGSVTHTDSGEKGDL